MVSLFFSPQGRIAKGPYWLGVIVLVVIGVVLSAISTYGPASLSLIITLLSILLIYPQVCVYVKRFHDAGKSGWWFVALILVAIVLTAGVSLALTLPMMAELTSQEVTPGSPEFTAMQRQMAQSLFLPATAASTVIWLVLSFIVGMLPSDPGENRFGPPTNGTVPAAA